MEGQSVAHVVVNIALLLFKCLFKLVFEIVLVIHEYRIMVYCDMNVRSFVQKLLKYITYQNQ